LDSLSGVLLESGTALVLDEISPADSVGVQYISENMLKIVLNIPTAGDIRARGENARWASYVFRTITTNANSPAHWMGPKMTFSEPLQRKSIWFQLTHPIALSDWSAEPSMSTGEDSAGTVGSSVVDRARELVASRQDILPEGSMTVPPELVAPPAYGAYLANAATALATAAALACFHANGSDVP
jgi:hypothetical protein